MALDKKSDDHQFVLSTTSRVPSGLILLERGHTPTHPVSLKPGN